MELTLHVRQGCSISPFLFNFVVNIVMEGALGGFWGIGVEPENEVKHCDLDCADDLSACPNLRSMRSMH